MGATGRTGSPVDLHGELISAVKDTGDVVIDPVAGTFSALDTCRSPNRNSRDCDING